MTLEARALVWLAVQACEVHNGSFAESVTQFVPNLGACNMQSNFSWNYFAVSVSGIYGFTGWWSSRLLYCCTVVWLFQGGLFSPIAALNREAWVICWWGFVSQGLQMWLHDGDSTKQRPAKSCQHPPSTAGVSGSLFTLRTYSGSSRDSTE